MNDYLKWIIRYGDPVYIMGYYNDKKYGFGFWNTWRTDFGNLDRNVYEEIEPPYKDWERDCLVFFFEEVSLHDEMIQSMYDIGRK